VASHICQPLTIGAPGGFGGGAPAPAPAPPRLGNGGGYMTGMGPPSGGPIGAPAMNSASADDETLQLNELAARYPNHANTTHAAGQSPNYWLLALSAPLHHCRRRPACCRPCLTKVFSSFDAL
jgi:hypothetical protein